MLIVILLIGFIMRAPITTPPLILGQLAHALGTQSSQLGILTTLPLVMFMLFSNFAAKPMGWLGLKKALLLAVGIVIVGSGLRLIMTMPTMIVGTVLIGIGIAHLNVFMPSLVAAYFPRKIGLYTTLYSFSMIFGNMVFNLSAAPIAQLLGWQMILVFLLIIPLVSFGGWLVIARTVEEKIFVQRSHNNHKQQTPMRLWTNLAAWPFLLTFGGQAIISYTFTAWMPALMEFHHVSAGNVGIVMACYALVGLPVSVFLPNLVTSLPQKNLVRMTLGAGTCGVIASVMLFWQNTSSMIFWLLQSLLIGVAIGFFFITAMTMFAAKTDSPYDTARLSGMAQAGGYCMSAFGPSLYGIAFAANPTGVIQTICYLILAMMMTITCLMIVKIDKI